MFSFLRQFGAKVLLFCDICKRLGKKETRRPLILRSNPVDISREHGAFFDVGDAEEAGGDAFEADGEAAVMGYSRFAKKGGKEKKDLSLNHFLAVLDNNAFITVWSRLT